MITPANHQGQSSGNDSGLSASIRSQDRMRFNSKRQMDGLFNTYAIGRVYAFHYRHPCRGKLGAEMTIMAFRQRLQSPPSQQVHVPAHQRIGIIISLLFLQFIHLKFILELILN